jgi:membrane peptidoglycan carboxypeptidase
VKILQGLFLIVLAGVLSGSALLASSAIKWAQELPALDGLDAYEFTATSEVFAADGTRIGTILPTVGEERETTNRIPVALDEVSPAALQAIIAYEDDQFFQHYGFDLPGIVRAFYEEFLGSSDRGGSTITTQVVKNTVLQDIRDDRSIERKAKEVLLAIELERRLTKAEILQRYINANFWGGNVHGLRAAAQTYFGKDPIELTLAEGLYLARLLPAPNLRHDDLRGTRASMREVLDKMVRQGTISTEMAERAWREDLQPIGWSVQYDGEGGIVTLERTGEDVLVQSSVSSTLSEHVLFAVRNWLRDRFGDAVVYGQGGLRVYTTIDVQAQRSAIQASFDADLPAGAQLAIVGLDPVTGEVLAMVGEKLQAGFAGEEFNRVTQAFRQPGSSFKPIVYATAIEQGGFHQAQILVDEETRFDSCGAEPYEPDNWDRAFDGYQTIREHLNRSRNIPAVKALEAATADAVAERARELGYDVSPFCALALGSFEATPLTHASAFSAFANDGVQVEAHFVSRVEDAEGNVLYEAKPRRTQVWTPQTAYIMLDLLHGNVADRNPFALSWRAGIEGRWVAGKTGTTNDDRDIWFVGATPGMVAAVWIGNDNNTSLASRTVGDEIVTSSRQPIYVWTDFVEGALRGVPANSEGFPVPDGIAFRSFDRKTGSAGGSTTGAFLTTTDLRQQGLLPELTISIPIDTETGLRATVDTPPERIEVIEVSPEEIDQYLTGQAP